MVQTQKDTFLKNGLRLSPSCSIILACTKMFFIDFGSLGSNHFMQMLLSLKLVSGTLPHPPCLPQNRLNFSHPIQSLPPDNKHELAENKRLSFKDEMHPANYTSARNENVSFAHRSQEYFPAQT